MASTASATLIVTMSRGEFVAMFGAPDLSGALCGYTREHDTRVILTLLCHARPRRVLEVGTALGHMAANFTRWSPDDATVLTIDLVRGMRRAAPGALEQQVEVPAHAEWGRFADHFGTAHKAFFITADTMTYDFGRLGPIEFAFIDGSHEFDHVWNDSRKAYDALAPGGWLVWHDFNSPVPWVQVREAIERIGFGEEVVHVEGTEVAILRKGEARHWLSESITHLNPPPHGGRRPDGCDGAEARGDGQPGEGEPPCEPQSITPCEILLPARTEPRCPAVPHQPAGGWVRVAWEGDFEELHSLALVNRAICRDLAGRGHDVSRITSVERAIQQVREVAGPDCRPSLCENPSSSGAEGDTQIHTHVHVRHQWPPKTEPPAHGRWVLMQPWEYGSLPKAWLPTLRRVDEIWAYSRYVRDCYLEADVARERVHVVPLGVDPDLFRPGLEPLPLPDGPDFRFLFVGGTIFRKGIDVLLKAFACAFRPGDGIGLVIKDMGAHSFYRGQTAEGQVAELRERGYSVAYIDRDLSEAEMAGLYSACRCLVHPFRGEGFALPVVEAMACGLPVIVTGSGPALDYASEETAYLIPAERVRFSDSRVGDIETIARPWLFEPDADALVELLKRVAGDRNGARAKGAVASAHIRENFTWARTVDAVERRLLALARLEVVQPIHPDIRPREPEQAEEKEISRKGAKTAKETLHEQPGAGASPLHDGGQPKSGFETSENQPPTHVSRPLSPFAPLRLGVNRPKISLTMIVRDEEKTLPNCLGSVQGLFDEIVAVDTGSRDRTREIARDFGARVFDFVWVDDFAAARNASLARATEDYAFWLDADDVIDPPQRVRLERLIADLRPGEQAGHVVKCACDPGPDGSGGDTVVDHVRLFPIREDVRWSYCVHEQILPALKRARLPVRWTEVTVRHTGYTDRALRARKLDRDTRILHQELAERPDDPFVLFNLGAIAIERQAWRQALEYLRHSLAGSAPTDSITRKLYALIARSHQMLCEHQLALAACATGLTFDPDDAELLFREAIVRRQTRDNDGAERCWRRILTLKRPDRFASVDQGIYGHLARRNLAALARERGDHAEEADLWRAVLAECPNDREAQHYLGAWSNRSVRLPLP